MKLYRELAAWWPLFSSPFDPDYEKEAQFFRETLTSLCDTPPTNVLELGSGGGNNAYYLKNHWNLTLVDRSPEMLAVSARLNPECAHLEGDMRFVRLGRVFDAVFVHDAVTYITTLGDLALTMQTVFAHCARGGAAVFAPDAVRERFVPETSHGGEDGKAEALRYLMWSFDPDITDTEYTECYSLVMRDRGGALHFEHDVHTLGLFSAGEWLTVMRGAGFAASSVVDPFDRVVFLAKRPR